MPEWVAYEIKRFDGSCINTLKKRPKWITEPDLYAQGIMPDDKSYAYPRTFTRKRKDWYSRGHLAMKMHADRLGQDASWNTHTFYNAVPQRQRFNAGIWLNLEDITAIWAQEYGSVWLVTGPIFADKLPHAHIGQEGEIPVAIPDALYKIVIKESEDPEKPDVLAFIYPQVGPGYYQGKPYDHTNHMTSVDEIEKLTGLDFLTSLPDEKEKQIEKAPADDIWPYNKENYIRSCPKSDYNE